MRKELIVYKDPKSPISEIYRTLRTNIQFMNTKKNLKTILVTSTYSGEGKSWISSNLAVTFAQADKKVLIIDGDLRKGRQYTIFGIAPKPGLSNYLSGVNINEDGTVSENVTNYIQRTSVENLYIMPAGNIPPNPSELLNLPQMVDLLERAKELYDIIIIDGTPCQLVTDSLILARIVDTTIIVAECKETKKEDLKKVVNNIENVGGKIAGVVLNRIPISAKRYEERYYYYSANNGQLNRNNATRNHSGNKSKYGERSKEKFIVNDKTKAENIVKMSQNADNNVLKQINNYIKEENNNMEDKQ